VKINGDLVFVDHRVIKPRPRWEGVMSVLLSVCLSVRSSVMSTVATAMLNLYLAQGTSASHDAVQYLAGVESYYLYRPGNRFVVDVDAVEGDSVLSMQSCWQ